MYKDVQSKNTKKHVHVQYIEQDSEGPAFSLEARVRRVPFSQEIPS